MMRNRFSPTSLSGSIQRELRRALQWAVTFLIAIFFGYGVYSIFHTRQLVEKLVVDHSVSLSQSASNSGNLLAVDRDIHQFVEAITRALPDAVEVAVTSNGRLLAREGEISGPEPFRSKIQKTIVTPSHDEMVVTVEMSHTKTATAVGLSFVLIVAVFYLFFRLLASRLGRSVERLAAPLAQTACWVEEIAENLPESAHQAPAALDSSLDEAKILNQSVGKLLSEIVQLDSRLAAVHFDRAKVEVADDLAHNIRSPLSSLEMMLVRLPDSSEEKTVMARSLARIRDIANSYTAKRREQLKVTTAEPTTETMSAPEIQSPSSIEYLPTIVSEAITEKRIQYREKLGVEIDLVLTRLSYGTFAAVHAATLKCILSNLVDNAVEAIRDSGSVSLCLESRKDHVAIIIRDTGQGIPAGIRPRLGEKGATFGKPNGMGLGLYHARKSVEAWGGTLEIHSEVGAGTTIALLVPHAPADAGFATELNLSQGLTVVSLDDDASVGPTWEQRLAAEGAEFRGVRFVSFRKSSELIAWCGEQNNSVTGSRTLYLIDYELEAGDIKGLDAIEKLKIGSQSVLASSRVEDHAIRRRCQALGCRFLPKTMAAFVPITWDELAQNNIEFRSESTEQPSVMQPEYAAISVARDGATNSNGRVHARSSNHIC